MLLYTAPKPKQLSETEVASLRASDLLAGLTYALDLTEGQPMGHSLRTCVIAMHVAKELRLSEEELGTLYYACLMKDAGCSSNASRMFQILGSDEVKAKRDVKVTDWSKVGWESLQYALAHVKPGAPFLERMRALWDLCRNQKVNARQLVQIRCERGASIARRIGLPESSAAAIHSLDELWNGSGQPDGLKGRAIPMLSRIMSLAQAVEVFHRSYGVAVAKEMVRKRSGRWFDPAVCRAFASVAKRETTWSDMEDAKAAVAVLEPTHEVLDRNQATLDNICVAFSEVIDAKSPFTYRPSSGVAGAAVAIGRNLNLSEAAIRSLRHAALLHDVGKLSVPNSILEKPGKLTEDEWEVMRKHPEYSLEILKRIPGFQGISELAASHHEKLDGSGYFRNMKAEDLSLPARILVVADIFDALAAKRPYRDALPLEKVFSILDSESPRALDPVCLDALKASSETDRCLESLPVAA